MFNSSTNGNFTTKMGLREQWTVNIKRMKQGTHDLSRLELIVTLIQPCLGRESPEFLLFNYFSSQNTALYPLSSQFRTVPNLGPLDIS